MAEFSGLQKLLFDKCEKGKQEIYSGAFGLLDKQLDAVTVSCQESDLDTTVDQIKAMLTTRANNAGFRDFPVNVIRHEGYVYVIANVEITAFDANGNSFVRPLVSMWYSMDTESGPDGLKVIAKGGIYPIPLPWLCAKIKIDGG